MDLLWLLILLIFNYQTKMQAVDHPYLVEYSLTSMERKGKAVDTRNDVKCGLCNDPDEDTVVCLI